MQHMQLPIFRKNKSWSTIRWWVFQSVHNWYNVKFWFAHPLFSKSKRYFHSNHGPFTRSWRLPSATTDSNSNSWKFAKNYSQPNWSRYFPIELNKLVKYNQTKDAYNECPVCLDDFVKDEECKLLPCMHFFHDKCILKWLERVIFFLND